MNSIIVFTCLMMMIGKNGVKSYRNYGLPCFLFSKERNHQLQAYTTNIFIVGKKLTKDDWINQACDEYQTRLTPIMELNTIFLKSDEELVKRVESLPKGKVFAMDETGIMYDSKTFTNILYKGYEDGGSTVHFIIGGFAGLPPEIQRRYPLISLSKMTWPHQLARLLLIEQIYRATEIRKGSSYHKE